MFWDDVSIGEEGSAHDSLNSLRGIGQTRDDANGSTTVNGGGGGINVDVSGQAQGGGALDQNTLHLNQSQRGGGRSNNDYTNSRQLAPVQNGAVQWSNWNWNEGTATNNGLNNCLKPQYLTGGDGVQTGDRQQQGGQVLQQQQEAQSLLHKQSSANRAQQQQSSQNVATHAQQQAAQQDAQLIHNQSQTMNEAQSAQNLGGTQLNPLQSIPVNASNALQLQTNSIPPNLPPQAHPFYLWMLQQQQAQQQQQNQQAQQTQAQQEAQRIAQQQEQERLKQEESRRLQQEEAKRLQEQVRLQKKEEARRQKEAQKQQQQAQQQAQAENAYTTIALNSTPLNPQQQLALFQYQLAVAQSQQNSNGQITMPQIQLPQVQCPQGGENLLMKQQIQLLQTLQQFQPQGQLNVPSIQALNGSAVSFQPVQTGQSMSPANQNIPRATPAPAQKARRSKNKTGNSSPIAPSDSTGVIGNTMKSLNNTMKSIHSQSEPSQAFESNKSSVANHQLISGSMKSLNSTLASTALMGTETLHLQQQGTPMIAHNVQQVNFQANPPTANSMYQNITARGAAPVTSNSMNVISSDTDGEVLSRKGGKTIDRYATESGTDDDFMLGNTRTNAVDASMKSSNTK